MVRSLTPSKLRSRIEARGYTAIARAIECDTAHAYRLLNNQRSMKLDLAERLAVALGCTVDELSGYLKWMRSRTATAPATQRTEAASPALAH